MIMKGAVCLFADLIRDISLPCVAESIQVSSYHGKTRGNLQVKGIESLDLFSKSVLLVDDIFDSGNTIAKKSPNL